MERRYASDQLGRANRSIPVYSLRPNPNVLYLFDHSRSVYRTTPRGVERVDNGTDGVLFIANPAWTPFMIGDHRPEGSPLEQVILKQLHFQDDGLSVDDRRVLFRLWLYSLFLPELFPTRPILALLGETGSGKTVALRRVGRVLFGPSFNVMPLSDDPKDFDAAITNHPFVAVDNSDSRVTWLEDKLAVVATGGSIKRRQYYTTNGLVEFPVRAFVGISSRTPHFRRDAVRWTSWSRWVPRLPSCRPPTNSPSSSKRKTSPTPKSMRFLN